MPVVVELKLEDLAKIALGAPELTNVNITVLHSLIDILLKKLNCQNEKVELSAFESKNLEKILETSKISPFAFNDDNVEMVADKLERLEALENDINNLDKKLETHLKEVKSVSNFDKTVLNFKKWESYGMEDLCTICVSDNDVACKLLKNTDFLKKLLRRLSAPMVERIFHFEEKINLLHKEFTAFIKRAEEEYLKIQLLETCIYEIEQLRKKVNENQAQFICTMEEVQDMLDAKLDKIHMPALKKYIRDNFLSIEQSIRRLEKAKDCPKAAGIIMEGVRCMSCGSTKVCGEVGVQPTAMLPNVTLQKPAKVNRKLCGCFKVMDSTSKFNRAGIGRDMAAEPRPRREDSPPKCAKAGANFDYIEGYDGSLYRKG